MGNLTWDDGLTIFKEQVPIGIPLTNAALEQDLQFWIVEERDYRSPNRMPDGERKSIWGPEQKSGLWMAFALRMPRSKFYLHRPRLSVPIGKTRKTITPIQLDSRRSQVRQFLRTTSLSSAVIGIGSITVSMTKRAAISLLALFTEAHAGGFSLDLRTDEHDLAIIGGFLSGEIKPGKAGQRQLAYRHHKVDGSLAYEYAFTR